MTPEHFLHRIQEIVGDTNIDQEITFSLPMNTPEEISDSVIRIRKYESELRILKKELVSHMRDLKSSFSSESAQVGSTVGSFLFRAVAGGRSAGRMNTLNRNSIRSQKLAALQPCERMKLFLDRFATELSCTKEKLKIRKLEVSRAA